MASQWVDMRDMKFLIHEVFKIDELLGKPPYEDHDGDMIDMVLTEAEKLTENEINPHIPTSEPEAVEARFEMARYAPGHTRL